MIKIELQSIKGDEVTFSLSVSPSLSPSLTSNFADSQYIKDFESRILTLAVIILLVVALAVALMYLKRKSIIMF